MSRRTRFKVLGAAPAPVRYIFEPLRERRVDWIIERKMVQQYREYRCPAQAIERRNAIFRERPTGIRPPRQAGDRGDCSPRIFTQGPWSICLVFPQRHAGLKLKVNPLLLHNKRPLQNLSVYGPNVFSEDPHRN
jgi:hypothetical protein